MIVNVYAFKDIQVGAFQKPFYDTNEPSKVQVMTGRRVAIATIDEIVKNHFRDLELYFLGTLDDESGVIASKPTFLLRLADYCKREENPDGEGSESA